MARARLFWAVALMGVWFGFVFLVSEDLMIIGASGAI